jgi:hypothetical protein
LTGDDVAPRATGSLFHYTDARGLLGILKTRTLFASDLRFLNDEQEAIYAGEHVRRAIRDMPSPASDPQHPQHNVQESFGRDFEEYRSALLRDLDRMVFPVYVACFCEKDDLLSQWRGYGADQGYAVEFVGGLGAIPAAQPPDGPAEVRLEKVAYGDAAIEQTVQTAIRAIELDRSIGHPGPHAHSMALELSVLMATAKHPGFSEEQEWRLIVADAFRGTMDVQFRVGTNSLIPYVAIPICPRSIVGIRVGPGRHQKLRAEGIRRLAEERELEVDVSLSQIPFRA